MANRTITMTEVSEVIFRLSKGESARAISRSIGTGRKTIGKIRKQAIDLGFKEDLSQDELDKIIQKVMEQYKTIRHSPGSSFKEFAKHHEQIKEWLDMPHMTVKQMYKFLKKKGVESSERSLDRYVRKHFDCGKRQITVRLEVDPGHQAQVDFAYVGMMVDPATGKKRKTYAFVMALSYSRYRFVRFVFSQDSETWIDCHIRAFEFYGVVPKTVLLDNLKAGVIKPHIYDPTVNRSYAELERHYGFIIDPSKVRIPRHKGKVERSVILIREQILAGYKFESISEANDHSLHWCRYENSQVVTSTTGQTPWERFTGEEKQKMTPLPKQRFEVPIWREVKVHRDCHVVFSRDFYSVPHQYVGEHLMLRATSNLVEIYYDHKLVKVHARTQPGEKCKTDIKDYPETARKYLEQTPKKCLQEAKALGPSVHHLLKNLLEVPTTTTLRKAQAILRLANQYGNDRLEMACHRALEYNNWEFKSIKKILEQNLDQKNDNQKQSSDVEKQQLPLSSGSAYTREGKEFAAIPTANIAGDKR